MNFKQDNSFFTIINIPNPYDKNLIVSWFFKNQSSRYRLILDDEINDQNLTLQSVHETFPGIKTIAVVTNPWEKLYRSYKKMLEIYENNQVDLWLDEADCTQGFDKFLEEVLSIKKLKNFSYWWIPSTQNIEWIEYIDETGTIQTIDYVLKAEDITEQFVPIQNFFESDIKYTSSYAPVEYKDSYSSKGRDLVYDTFKDDIERFGYQF